MTLIFCLHKDFLLEIGWEIVWKTSGSDWSGQIGFEALVPESLAKINASHFSLILYWFKSCVDSSYDVLMRSQRNINANKSHYYQNKLFIQYKKITTFIIKKKKKVLSQGLLLWPLISAGEFFNTLEVKVNTYGTVLGMIK